MHVHRCNDPNTSCAAHSFKYLVATCVGSPTPDKSDGSTESCLGKQFLLSTKACTKLAVLCRGVGVHSLTSGMQAP